MPTRAAKARLSKSSTNTAAFPRTDLPFDGFPFEAGSSAHYADPAYYDKAYASRTEDARYYVSLAKTANGRVLEYGVGNGRVALALSRAGIDVTGVDASAPMLDALRKKPGAEALRLVHGDMREVRLRQRFELVIAPFNTVLHLYTRTDMERFLARVKAHLAPGGRFVFDFSVPRLSDLARDPDRFLGAPRFRYPGVPGLTRYAERFDYDPLAQTLLVEMRFSPEQGQAWSTPLTHRQFFPREMEALLHYNGFQDQHWTADFTSQAPNAFSDSLIVSCSDPSTGRRSKTQRRP